MRTGYNRRVLAPTNVLGTKHSSARSESYKHTFTGLLNTSYVDRSLCRAPATGGSFPAACSGSSFPATGAPYPNLDEFPFGRMGRYAVTVMQDYQTTDSKDLSSITIYRASQHERYVDHSLCRAPPTGGSFPAACSPPTPSMGSPLTGSKETRRVIHYDAG